MFSRHFCCFCFASLHILLRIKRGMPVVMAATDRYINIKCFPTKRSTANVWRYACINCVFHTSADLSSFLAFPTQVGMLAMLHSIQLD